jgi:hypothetical protein
MRTQCFFGDICLNGVYPEPNILEDYIGSLYDIQQQPPGVQPDMPAIFKIHSFRTYHDVTIELPDSPGSNASAEYGYGAGYALCIEYPDQVTLNDEIFTFELWVLVKTTSEGIFDYQHYATYTCTDGGIIEGTVPGGVLDFAIGDCSPMSTFTYPWQLSP